MLRALRKSHIPARARDTLLGQHCKRMFSPIAVKFVEPWRPRKTSGKAFRFAPSACKFGYVEEEALRIQIIDKDSFSDAMGIKEATDPLPPSVTDLYLDKFGPDQILVFNPNKHPGLNEDVCSFLVKLHIVAINNAQSDEDSREERHIDDMAIDLMRAVKYDDGRDLIMLSSSLYLSIGGKHIPAKADREGRRRTNIVWVMQANKHLGGSKYKRGDIQLASSMISAFQENSIPTGRVFPERMMGIQITGDKVSFYSMRMTESYLEDLTRGAPGEDIEVFKYPDYKGLRITVPEERKQILNHLWSMRCYAAGL